MAYKGESKAAAERRHVEEDLAEQIDFLSGGRDAAETVGRKVCGRQELANRITRAMHASWPLTRQQLRGVNYEVWTP